MDNQSSVDRMSGTEARKDWVEVKGQHREQQYEPTTQALTVNKPDEPHKSEIRISAGVFTVSVTDGFNDAVLIRVLNALNGLDGVRREAAS